MPGDAWKGPNLGILYLNLAEAEFPLPTKRKNPSCITNHQFLEQHPSLKLHVAIFQASNAAGILVRGLKAGLNPPGIKAWCLCWSWSLNPPWAGLLKFWISLGSAIPKTARKRIFFFFLEYSKQEHWEVMGFPQKSPLMLG